MVLFSPLADPIWAPPGPSVPLTLSGNEITPYVRRFGKEGDGLNPNELLGKYSLGIEEATQNKVTQSIPGASATTNVTKAGDAAATLTLVADADRPFPNAAATVWEFDNSAGSTDATVDFAGNTGNTNKHSVSIYAKKSAGTPTLSLEGAGGVNIMQTAWGRSKSENLTPGGTTENLRITAPAGAVLRFTAAQLEEQPIALSFVMSNGSAASRSAARLRLSDIARYMPASQGWVALLMQIPWGNSNEPLGGSGFPATLAQRDDGNNQIAGYYDEGNNRFAFTRISGGAGSPAEVSLSIAANDLVFYLGALTPAVVALALNGGAFTSTANTSIPTLTNKNLDVLSRDGSANHMDASLLFFATGKMPSLTTGFSAALNNIARNNRIDSRPEDLPGGCTFKWPPADGDVTRALVAA